MPTPAPHWLCTHELFSRCQVPGKVAHGGLSVAPGPWSVGSCRSQWDPCCGPGPGMKASKGLLTGGCECGSSCHWSLPSLLSVPVGGGEEVEEVLGTRGPSWGPMEWDGEEQSLLVALGSRDSVFVPCRGEADRSHLGGNRLALYPILLPMSLDGAFPHEDPTPHPSASCVVRPSAQGPAASCRGGPGLGGAGPALDGDEGVCQGRWSWVGPGLLTSSGVLGTADLGSPGLRTVSLGS